MASHMRTNESNMSDTGFTGINLPPEFEPLSPWAYFGLSILYAIPLIGLVFLIVFSLSDKNINRRNFSRSYFCVLILLVVVIAVLVVTGTITNVTSTIASDVQNIQVPAVNV